MDASNTFKQRKTLRLEHYDYSLPGDYFITVCAHRRCCLFGKIENETMHRNDAGNMLENLWREIDSHFSNAISDAFVVMPNHIHGIVRINNQDTNTLQGILRWWKSMTTREYAHAVRYEGWQPFDRMLWQRSFHERVVRTEREYRLIVEYIQTNPLRWVLDRHHPDGHVHGGRAGTRPAPTHGS